MGVVNSLAAPTSSEEQCAGLVLVPRGSKSACVMEHAKLLSQGAVVPLTLRSGLAIVPRTARPRTLFLIIDYVSLGVGDVPTRAIPLTPSAPARSALRASLKGRLLVREGDERVFDVSFSRFAEGQGVSLVSERGAWGRRVEGDASNGQARAGREYRVNEDGTISPWHAPDLVLGAAPPKLLLLPAGSPRQLLFSNVALQLFAGARGVPLISDCGHAIVPVGMPVDAIAGWRYLELAVGAASVCAARAVKVGLEGLAVQEVNHGMVFDVGNLTGGVSEGTAVLLTGGRTLQETLKPATRRSFAFNGDGTLGVVGYPLLVVGVDYELAEEAEEAKEAEKVLTDAAPAGAAPRSNLFYAIR